MILQQIQQAARECGHVLLNADRTHTQIETKSGISNNLVTTYDKAVQQILREKLLKLVPHAHFVGEEEDFHDNITYGDAFIVDPIDGTTNFVKDYKGSAISIAMTHNGQRELGVIYNPYLDEMFYAQRGKGAFCNGKAIHVSDKPLHQGLTIYGSSSYYRELTDESFRLLRKCFDRSMDFRRSGSAAIDLCSIAAGRAELFFEMLLQPWDYAAGSLLVEEAGGKVSCIDGSPLSLTKGCSVLAVGSHVNTDFMRQ